MRYQNLQELLSHSSSSRNYFLSLPVPAQLALHKLDTDIRTAADLHFYADILKKASGALFSVF